jgi:hypothetical protein
MVELEHKRKELEAALTDLTVCNAPRVILNWYSGGVSYVAPLQPIAGQKVSIEYIPYDAEARRAALNIERTLVDAGWNVQKPLLVVDGLRDGVSVQPSWTTPVLGQDELLMRDLDHRAEVAADKLIDFLHSYNWQAKKEVLSPPNEPIRDTKVLAAGSMKVQVGLFPPAISAATPGQRKLTQDLEEFKRKREETAAESRRKLEQNLAGLAPEELKRRLDWQAELEASKQAIRVEYAQPCQALNWP